MRTGGMSEAVEGGRALGAGPGPSLSPDEDPGRRVMGLVAIIPAYNAAWCIGRCLAGLASAGFAPEACIVADDGSSDDTAAIARDHGARVLTLTQRGGAASARNAGAGEAGPGVEVLLFVDADVVVHADVRSRVISTFRDGSGVDAVFGSYDDAPDRRDVVSQYRNLLHHYVHLHGSTEPGTFWTGCGAVRRAAFDEVGGFDPSQRMMEDIEFGMRLSQAGRKIRLDSDIRCKHLKAWSLGAMIRMDLFDRAIPWSRIMLFDGGVSGELNLAGTHRASALLVVFFAAGLLGAFVSIQMLWLAAGALLAFLLLNLSFFRLVLRQSGAVAAAAAIPLHMIHYCCAVSGLAWVMLLEYVPSRLGLARRGSASQGGPASKPAAG